MSEVGKYFDSILDYKLRQENEIHKKPDTPRTIPLPPSTIPNYYKDVTWKQFVGAFTERDPNTTTPLDPIANLGLDFEVETKTYGDFEVVSELTHKHLEGIKEKQGIYDFEVCCDEPPTYEWKTIPPIDIIIPVQHIQLSCVLNREGVTFTEIFDQATKEDSSDEEQSMDARVAENGIAVDFKDDDNLSVYRALEAWINFVK